MLELRATWQCGIFPRRASARLLLRRLKRLLQEALKATREPEHLDLQVTQQAAGHAAEGRCCKKRRAQP